MFFSTFIDTGKGKFFFFLYFVALFHVTEGSFYFTCQEVLSVLVSLERPLLSTELV